MAAMKNNQSGKVIVWLILIVGLVIVVNAVRNNRPVNDLVAVNRPATPSNEVTPPSTDPNSAPSANFSLTPGDYEYTMKHDGAMREYLLHIPASYSNTVATPLVLAHHGGGGNAWIQSEHYNFIEVSDREGFIVAFPNGYHRQGLEQIATWNAGDKCCGVAAEHDSDDIGFIRAVVADIQSKVNIDASRIYATGFSNGGMISYRLACEASDLIAAIAPAGGTERVESCNPSRPVPVHHVHAIDDSVVIYDGGCNDRDCVAGEGSTGVEETINRWVSRNSCNATPQTENRATGVECRTYSGCAGGAEVKMCVTPDGGHSWPGGSKPRLTADKPSQKMDATTEIWNFLSRFSL